MPCCKGYIRAYFLALFPDTDYAYYSLCEHVGGFPGCLCMITIAYAVLEQEALGLT
jgi:hypothetical protein